MIEWLKKLLEPNPKVRKRVLSDDEFNSIRKERQNELDRILDKVHRKGIHKLNKEERKFLESYNK